VSPWEILFGHSPEYKSFKVFGCACYPLLRPYNSHKFNLRSTQCIFLGYSTNAKGYLFLDPTSNCLYTSRHVVFDENTFPFHAISPIPPPSSSSTPNPWLSNLLFFQACSHNSILGPHPSTILPPTSILGPHPSTISQPISSSSCPPPIPINSTMAQSPLPEPSLPILTHQPNQPIHPISPSIQPIPTSTSLLPESHFPDPNPSSSSLEPPPSIPNTHPMTTRSKSGISKKKILHFTTTKPKPDYLQTIPPTLNIASQFPEWTAAMKAEFDALQRQQTWSLVPPPSGQNIIGCCWVYKLKRHSDGSIARYKARLVAKGFH
jgi:hypothetical protein